MGTSAGSLWEKVPFGRSGLRVSRLGIGSSYGVGGADLVRAFERGVNFFFFGLRRRAHFADGVKELTRRHRDDMVIAVQSYSRAAILIRPSVEMALRKLGVEYADLLGLGWWNDVPPRRVLDTALALKESGKVRHLVISSHPRPTFVELARDPSYAGIMVRYSAAHPGAEEEVFPHLAEPRPGVLSFTATRWGSLLDPKLTPPGEKTPTATDCYRFVLSAPAVDATLTGPRDAAQLDGALAALDRGPLSADELAWMRRVGAVVRRDAKGGSPVDFLDRWTSKFKRRPAESG